MANILDSFEDLPAVVEKIDDLCLQAKKTKGKKEKRNLLGQAQELADAYQEHCEKGGNMKKQFNSFL